MRRIVCPLVLSAALSACGGAGAVLQGLDYMRASGDLARLGKDAMSWARQNLEVKDSYPEPDRN
jgi:hypothetical protein